MRERAALQVVCATALFLWLVPTLAFARTGGWAAVAELPAWRLNLVLQLLLVPAALGLRATGEFVKRGNGTPIPYDPPRRLVSSGPYSYVRNPMQLSMTLVFFFAAVVLWNEWLAAAGLVAFAYSAGLASWHEGLDLEARFGDAWLTYRKNVRSWLPRVRPHVVGESRLLVAFSCSTCSSVGRWFVARNPVGLTIAPAESAGDAGVRRITYLPSHGPPERGVAAVAHALEHVHLGWAVVGWLLMLPVVRQLAQLLADLFGPTPGPVAGRAYDESACSLDARTGS